MGYRPWGRRESDMTERLNTSTTAISVVMGVTRSRLAGLCRIWLFRLHLVKVFLLVSGDLFLLRMTLADLNK